MSDAKKKVVAVVDDNRTDLTMAGLLIEKEGFEPALFESFSDLTAFLKAERERIGLVMLDVNMPGLTGIDMLKRLKREVGLRGVPVVMMTGDSSAETVKTSILNGAVDYIVKPIDPMIFEGKLKKLLKVDTGKQASDWVEYRLNQIKDAKVTLQVPGTLISLGELTLTIYSEYSVTPGSALVLDTTIFKEIGIMSVPTRVETCTPSSVGDGFNLKCAIIGLAEADLQKIRIFCRSLWRNNTSAA